MRKKVLFLVLGFILSVTGNAYDFEKNGFYYNITSIQNLTVELTCGDVKYSGDIVVPDSVDYSNKSFVVTRLGDYVFQGCGEITSIVIPHSVTTTGAYTFSGCSNLKTLTIPYSITEIGKSTACSDYGRYCFSGCYNLENLIFEEGSTATLYLHPNDWYTGSCRPFVGCRLKSLYIGRNIECYSRDHADWCNPFYGQSSLTEIHFGESVTTIISRMFQSCTSLEHIDIPSNIKYIGAYAFLDCTKLNDIIFQEGLLSIGNNAFKNCKSIKKVTIPCTITDINSEAFLNCTSITQVFSKSEIPCRLAENAFPGITYLSATLYVPIGTKKLYENADGWRDFSSIVETDDFDVILDIPQPSKCSTPSISYSQGKLIFSCDTEGADCVTTIGDKDIKTHYGNEINLMPSYTISVYAKAEGYMNSDTVTAKLTWSDSGLKVENINVTSTTNDKCDVNDDGTVDVADIAVIIDNMAGRARLLNEKEK